MKHASNRFHEIAPSQFAHERSGLDMLRELIPDRAPFQVWTNFEFRDGQGKWHEVDALVLGERRLHLVELKHYQGSIRGSSYQWLRGRRTEDNPLLLARRKSQRLASLLKDALREYDPSGAARVPFVQECVFLHADDFHVEMPEADRRDLFGPDGRAAETGLPSLAERLLEPADRGQNALIANDDILVALFNRIGFGAKREREVGSWRLIERSAEGEGWQDWSAEHKLLQSKRARVRFFVTPPGASDNERSRVRALAMREYEITKRLNHDGVARPEDLVEDDLGIGLVYPREQNEARLDLWLTDHDDQLSIDERVTMVRQLAETLKYVHQRHLVHRALSPAAVTVTEVDGAPALTIGDWQFVGDSEIAERTSRGTATRLFDASDTAETGPNADAAGSYLAPEARWVSDVDRIRLDVFALGALSYLILARPGAGSRQRRAPGPCTAR